jgi:hypothetical protein
LLTFSLTDEKISQQTPRRRRPVMRSKSKSLAKNPNLEWVAREIKSQLEEKDVKYSITHTHARENKIMRLINLMK